MLRSSAAVLLGLLCLGHVATASLTQRAVPASP